VQTAKTLGISRNILRTHLKKVGLIGLEQGVSEAGDERKSSPDVIAASVGIQ
jgi:hypothetical protein